MWGMTTAEEILTFAGMCEVNGMGPAGALDMPAFDPDWFAADDVRPAPRRRTAAAPAKAALSEGCSRRAAAGRPGPSAGAAAGADAAAAAMTGA